MIDFQADVLEKSHETPVVVDFWAPWCGPCRVLGPVIESVAEDQVGKWNLVKLNTEEQPEIAAQYQIRSIPNVKLFYRGEVIAEFLGALPKKAIEKWLADHLPNEKKADLAQLLEEMASGAKQIEDLKVFVDANAEIEGGRIELAKRIVFEDPLFAAQLVDDIKLGHESFQVVEAIRQLKAFVEMDLDTSKKAGQLLEAAKEKLKAMDRESAIQLIIDAVTIDKSFTNDLPRKVGISLFQLHDLKDPLVKNYRWKFDMAIY